MLTFVTFKYRQPGYRTTYTAEHVNVLQSMIARNYHAPHRFLCVTDDPEGVVGETYPLWDDHRGLVNPSHPTSRPNCYPRLKLFDPDLPVQFGDRFVSMDLDMAITGDITPLFDRPEDFVIYAPKPDRRYQGSLFLHRRGTRSALWTEFDPVETPKITVKAGFRGSDQAWIRYRYPNEAIWTPADGVHSYLYMVPARATRAAHPVSRWKNLPGRTGSLPPGTRLVSFAGQLKPWEELTQQASPWLKEHYR